MKPTTLLLAASLVANVALVGVIYSGRSTAPAMASTVAGKNSASTSAGAKADASSAGLSAAAAGKATSAAAQAALGRAFARFADHMWAARGGMDASLGRPWWRKYNSNAKDREEMALARRELSDAMIAAFGDDLGIGGVDNTQLSFLSDEKRGKLRSVLEDYDELMAKFGAQNGIQLASDRDKLKLLQSERDHDIAALLTPDELADYQMRTSASANTLRNRYGDAITDEDEFKKLYTLQKAFDDKFATDNLNGRVTPDQMKARSDAALQLQSDMRAAVGDDAYAALRRASDSDLRNVDALVTRLNLAPDTTDRVAAARDNYAAQSQAIMADTATPFPERRAQLQQLATQAKSDLTAALGAEAADAYAQRSPWISMLQGGVGFSTSAKDSPNGALSLSGAGGTTPSVFPVMPAGVAGSGTRQVVNMVSTSGGPSAGGGQMFFAPTGGGAPGGTQVYSVTSTMTGDGHVMTDAPGATVTKIISAPPPDAPPSQPATPPKE